jgi:glutamate synthase (NADPH) small chain
MDRDSIREREARCIAEEPPACATACPVHVDARAMSERIRQGDFDGALAVLSRSVPLPRILCRVCDAPCERACRRNEAGGAVAIRALERASVDFGKPRKPARVPPRNKRIAVIGAGMSGLTAAADLTSKGYEVVLFEAGEALGGRLRALGDAVLPAAEVRADLERALSGVDVRTASPVRAVDALASEFDAVYAAMGPAADPGALAGLARDAGGGVAVDPATLATSDPRVFAGGGLVRGDAGSPLLALYDGRRAATSIDRAVQRASLTAGRALEAPYPSRLFTRTERFPPLPPVRPADGAAGLTRDEARAEAARCFPCACRECLDACPYLRHHGANPKRYIREIYNNDCIVMGSHKSNRLANTCSLCGLCEKVCPEKLGMAETCREARESMVRKGKMPPSLHEFALRDMAFSLGEDFALAENAPGTTSSRAVFFPGCQLSASSPEHVVRAYAWLRETMGDVGVHLGCCGAPADWAGRRDAFCATLAGAAATWGRLGARRVITTCPSCTRVFRDNIADVEVVPLWTLLPPPAATPSERRRLAIHDPCAARDDHAAQDAARTLLHAHGVEVIEPEYARERTTCCSFGGLMSFADRAVADAVVRQRTSESDADFVTYCAMCRDNFAARGKRSLHVLDLVFPSDAADPAARRAPGFSQRRAARRDLKARLMSELWSAPPPARGADMKLILADAVAEQMERRMILREDIERTILYAEASGDKLVDVQTSRFIASHRPELVTYWVIYSCEGDGFVVHAVWSHRMELAQGPTS